MGFFDTLTDAFSRDGAITRICEKVPIVGHLTASVQLLAGNPEHAKRAAATAKKSIITTAGAASGFVVGGPLGAIAGAAAASAAEFGAEYAISTTINDQEVKGKVGEFSIDRLTSPY